MKKGSLIWPQQVSSSPLLPGVYSFLDEKNNILYVGKAKKLRSRLRNYTQTKRLRPRIKKMASLAKAVKYQVLESELQALLIEAELIRLHQPQYNTLLKDDKSPIYLVITDELFPRVLKVRKRDLNQKTKSKPTILGPFQSSYKLNQVLKIARKVFPWCNLAGKTIHSHKEYQKNAKNPQQRACFYQHIDLCPGACIGKITPKKYQKNIQSLILFLQGRKAKILNKLHQEIKNKANQLKFEDAQKIKRQIQAIKEVTSKRYKLKPDLIYPIFQKNQTSVALLHLKKILRDQGSLPANYNLHRIEGYDVSNIQGKNPAVSMVVFEDGNLNKSNYRIFNIRKKNTPDDFAMMAEAIKRRQNHPEWGRPNLLLLDGGQGQISKILSIWKWAAPVIGLAKKPDRLVIPQTQDKDKSKCITIKLNKNHPTLKLLAMIRDESHRFAQKQHKKLRKRQMLEIS